MLKQLIKKMRTIGTVPSTCNNVNDDIAGGRKTLESATAGTTEGGVLVNVDASGDAIVFADEMGSVPSLESEDSEDSDYESEEESDEEEEGKCYLLHQKYHMMGVDVFYD